MTSHFREVCKHGYVYSQCRCPGGARNEVLIECPFDDKPEHRAPRPSYRPRHAR